MELKPNGKLGSHEIVSAIGEGDMGKVWRAMAARNKGTGIP